MDAEAKTTNLATVPTVCEAAELVRSRAVSPVELVSRCLAEIEAWDGRINAYSELFAERALDAARAPAEAAVVKGAALGPLHVRSGRGEGPVPLRRAEDHPRLAGLYRRGSRSRTRRSSSA